MVFRNPTLNPDYVTFYYNVGMQENTYNNSTVIPKLLGEFFFFFTHSCITSMLEWGKEKNLNVFKTLCSFLKFI